MNKAKVILIGGAPGAGKTTLGNALASKLGVTSLSIDDLMTAAKTVTTPTSHPGLHVMSAVNYIDYFTESSVDQLIADATLQHQAMWPVVEKVVRNHSSWGSAIVIDGWAMRPDWVFGLDLANVLSFWLVADEAVLREREKKNVEFFGKSPDPKRMLENFLGRSLWYNGLIREEAAKFGMSVLIQDGGASVLDLLNRAIKTVDNFEIDG